MTYRFERHIDPSVSDAFVIRSDQNTLFQCSFWAKIKSNWDSVLTGVYDDEQLVATALILVRKLGPWHTLFYIPRGPVMDYGNRELVRFYLFKIREMATEYHAIDIRFDPSVLSLFYSYRSRNEEHDRMNQDLIAFLKDEMHISHKGFTTRIIEATQPRYNASMAITADYRERLEHKTVKCIRAAERRGIELYEGMEYIPDFSVAMHYTEIRKQVALRDESYFRHMAEVYGNHCICMVAKLNFPKQIARLERYIAEQKEMLAGNLTKKERTLVMQQLSNDEKELEKLQSDYVREGKDEVIAGGILAVYNDRLMELLYMGNHPDYLRMYSSYLLYAECLDRCVKLGIPRCSFGGVEGTLDDGLTLFKSNWLMDIEEYIGEFNWVLNRPMYTLFETVYPAVLKHAMKIRGKGELK